MNGFLKLNYSSLVFVTIVLAACGGSGGGNTAPTVDAGTDRTVDESTTISLSGSGSDADGDSLSFTWSQVSGPAVDFANPSDPATTVELPAIPIGTTETIVLSLQVSDNNGGSTEDELMLTVNSTDYVVYTAGVNMFKYETTTGTNVRLSGTLVPGGVVRDFFISPDGRYVAYRADQDLRGHIELYVAAADGSSVDKVSLPVIGGGTVRTVHWSPDSTKIAYSADANVLGVPEAYVVNVDGSGGRKISDPNAAISNTSWISDLEWSGDSRYVGYQVRSLVNNTGIFVETVDTSDAGAAPVRVNLPAVAGGAIRHFRFSPDSSRLAIYGDLQTNDRFEIFSVRPDGSDFVKVSQDVAADVNVGFFFWSHQGSQLAYTIDSQNLDSRAVFVANGDGANRRQVSAPVSGDDFVFSTIWSPDGRWLLYSVWGAGGFDVWRVRNDGSDPLMLKDRNTPALFPTWSPDSQRIAYMLRDASTDRISMFTVNVDGTGETPLNSTFSMDGDVSFFRWSPTSEQIVYNANPNGPRNNEYFVATADGTNSYRVHPPFRVTNGNPQNLPLWSADGSRLLYSAFQDDDSRVDLYLASPDGLVNERISELIGTGVGPHSFSP